jgi:hypothetical protein
MTEIAPRVGYLIRLLGCDRDGEVLVAARALQRTLRDAGFDFHNLADWPNAISTSADPQPTVTILGKFWPAIAFA